MMMQGLSGLQNLIARGMRNPPQRASVPPGLQALIQAQQALKQTAAPVTPSGVPTIAGQTEQAIQQQLQPAMPQAPQMGQPQAQVLGQGIPQAAQMAGIAAQQQQAQQQQAMQQAMQMAQQQQAQPDQAQPMAEGGIASLPAHNMARMEQYAHGGVIGFGGPEGSLVKTPEQLQADLENAKNMAQAAALSQDSEAALNYASQVNQIQSELDKISKPVVSKPVVSKSRYQSSGVPKGLTPEKIEQIKSEYKSELGVGQIPGQYRRGAGGIPVALTEEEKTLATEAALKKQQASRESRQYSDQYQPTTSQGGLSSAVPAEEKPKYQYEEPVKVLAPLTTQQRQGTVAPTSKPPAVSRPQGVAASGPTGVAALAAPAVLAPAISPAEAITQAQAALGGAADLSELKNMLGKANEARQAIPLQRQAELEQLGKGDIEIAEMRKKATEESAFNRALAVLSGMGRGGIGGAAPAYLGFEQAQQAERARQIAEDQVRAATRSAIVDAQNARKAGDLDAAATSMAKYQELVTHRQANVTAVANAIMQSEASKESARTHAAATVAAAQIHGLSSIEGAKIHAAVQREGFTKLDSGERLAAAYAEVKQSQGDKAAEDFLQDRAKVQAVLGGVKYEGMPKDAERQAKMAAEVSKRMKEETGLLNAQLQNPNLDPKKRAAIQAQVSAARDRIRAEVAQEMPAVAGDMAAPTAAVKPTLQQFLTRARSANPGVSDADLTAFYNQKYGAQ